MANFLPLLLIGGGAAVVMASGKKKGGYKFKHLRVGPGCKTAFLNDKNFVEEIKRIQGGDDDARVAMLDDLNKFWLEDMPTLIMKVQPDEEDLQRGAEQLVRAALPSCYRSKKAMKASLKKHIKEAENKADLEKKIMPMLTRYLVLVIIYAGYEVNLIRDGKMDASDLSDFQQDLVGVGMGDADWEPIDPNQMAATRPHWLTESALLTVGALAG